MTSDSTTLRLPYHEFWHGAGPWFKEWSIRFINSGGSHSRKKRHMDRAEDIEWCSCDPLQKLVGNLESQERPKRPIIASTLGIQKQSHAQVCKYYLLRSLQVGEMVGTSTTGQSTQTGYTVQKINVLFLCSWSPPFCLQRISGMLHVSGTYLGLT